MRWLISLFKRWLCKADAHDLDPEFVCRDCGEHRPPDVSGNYPNYWRSFR